MTNCYYCDKLITNLNKSKEHVIQNALGGRLISPEILCKTCNNKTLNKFDIELVKQFHIATILDIKKDADRTHRILTHTKNGRKWLIDSKLTPYNTNPIFTPLENGGMRFSFRDLNEARKTIKGWKNKKPSINIDEELNKIIVTEEKVEGSVYFDSALIYGENAFKAILKIALNYYFSLNQSKEYVNYPLDFLKNNIKGNYNNIVFHYYCELDSIYKTTTTEILHLLYLKGDSKEKLLYCYVELCGLHCFLVVLNYNYNGSDFEKTYCYDLQEQTIIDKKIELNIKKTDIDTYRPPIALGNNSLEIFNTRLARILDIKNIKYEFSKLDDAMYIKKNGYSEKNI